nr:MLP-like protein 423 [Ipomoea batatas]
MAQIWKLEVETQIKSASKKFFDIYLNNSRLLPKICPAKIRSVQVLEGDGKSVGSVRLWTYNLGGNVIAKDKIDAVDEENRSVTFALIGGEVTNYFKSFRATLQACGNSVKWTLEYEKANDNVPTPHSHVEFLMNVARDVDEYLLKT